ncbi:type VI secretion protein, partial [Pseudomonas aeruginosa]
MVEKAILPLALGACLAYAAPAWAEGDSPDYPKPLADDVALPLPCGGEMVFRQVYVLAEGALDDR